VFGEGGALATSGGELQTPHFFLKAGTVPEMDAMQVSLLACSYLQCIPVSYSVLN
jgi:hypothetical protein